MTNIKTIFRILYINFVYYVENVVYIDNPWNMVLYHLSLIIVIVDIRPMKCVHIVFATLILITM